MISDVISSHLNESMFWMMLSAILMINRHEEPIFNFNERPVESVLIAKGFIHTGYWTFMLVVTTLTWLNII